MAVELLTETPSLLREGHLIFFTGGWPSNTQKDGRWFRVERSHQIKLDVPRIVSAGNSIDLDFAVPAGGDITDLNLSLIPTNSHTLYELLFGMKGLPFVYPRYNNSYYQKLEASNVVPDTSDADLRYLGFYDEGDSPFDAPRLREHVVQNQQAPVLRVYNDQIDDEALIFRFIINRCRLVDAIQPPEDLRRVARIAKYHEWFNY